MVKVLAPIYGNGVEIRQMRGLTTHVVRSWYYWEFVVYVEKILLMVLITYMNDYNEGIQICLIFFILFICLFLQIINKPYHTEKLNTLQKYSLITCFLLYLTRLIVRTFGLNNDLKRKDEIEGL